MTLVLGVPLLFAGLARAARGSIRGLLLWVGLLAYAVDNYAFYLLGAALNVSMPLYVVALVLAAVALILVLSHIEVAAVARSFRPSAPVRAIGASLASIGIGSAVVWVTMWATYVFAGRPTPIDPEDFKIVAALGLSLMVPALTISGILLWRWRNWGYLIASIASIQGTLYLLVLSVDSVVAIRRGLATAPGELPIWGVLAVLTTILALVLLTNVEGGRAAVR